MKMAMIKPISKTAATFSSRVEKIDKRKLSGIYYNIGDTGYYRVDMAPEHSTILGTRYDDQPYNILNIYKTEDGFNVSLEPFEETPITYSAIYWRKIGQNPMNSDFDKEKDGQFFLVPNQIFSPGDITMTSVEQTEDYPRHLVCAYK